MTETLTQMFKTVARYIRPLPTYYVIDDGRCAVKPQLGYQLVDWDRVGVAAYELTNIVWIMGGDSPDGHGTREEWTLDFELNYRFRRIDISARTKTPGTGMPPIYSVAGLAGQMDQRNLNALVATSASRLVEALSSHVHHVQFLHAQFTAQQLVT